ncbi:MAG: hypothetical protein KDC54_03315, partial [Lewinella sp.]|nr:hypothetical protein [Lewinella sp.]
PWSMSLGVRLGYLATWRGSRQHSAWVRGTDHVIREGQVLYRPYTRIIRDIGDGFSRSDFRSWDGGIQFRLHYRLLPGLGLQAGVYQGFRNLFRSSLFGQSSSHHLTSFSLGFTARLR